MAVTALRPFCSRKSRIRWPRIKFHLRRIMFKCLQRPPRMIPRRDQNHAADIFRAQHFNCKLRVLAGRCRIAFDLDGAGWHIFLMQNQPIDFVIARTSDDDAWRGALLKKFRRAFGAELANTAAENDNYICRRLTAVHAQKFFRIEIRDQNHRRQQQDEADSRAENPFENHASQLNRSARVLKIQNGFSG